MSWDGTGWYYGTGMGWDGPAGLVRGRAWTGRTADGRSVSRGGGYSGQTLHGWRSSRSRSGKAPYLPPSTTTPGCAGGLGRAGLGRVMIRPGGPSSAPGAERAPPGGLRQWGFGSIRVPRAAIWAWNWAAGGGVDHSHPGLTRPRSPAAPHPHRWTSCATAPVRGGLALPRQHCAWAAGGHDEQGLPAWLVPGESPAERRQQPTPVVPVPFPPRPCPALACARTNGDVIRWPDAMGWDGGC